MKQIRQRLTYANVMSSFAVFLVLGGATAFAATKIGSNEIKANAILTGKIKKEAVTTGKIKQSAVDGSRVKDGSLTGADIAAGTLGTVPNAVNSVNAVNAVNSQTTSQIRGFTYKGNNGDSEVIVLNDFFGLTLRVSCTAGANQGLRVKASSSSPLATISQASTWQGTTGVGDGGTANNGYSQISGTPLEIYGPAATTKITNGGVNIGFSTGYIIYSQPTTNTRVTVTWQYNNSAATCYWAGNAVGTS